ncbi:YwdI family protein [Bacillus chungangensis]|uniref:YwdI family protein n=1 Tax=Bacillus chungangensis TaxID=587633 RepID=A0ABT9WX98_9BACI|nr:YwdI family protein [Bacillus chungangensis]MDQ0177497.1 hypothetical protein [Bacillus chungangensis]
MEVSYQSLLEKMTYECSKARQAEQLSEVREHVYSLKVLCELLLDRNHSHYRQEGESTLPMPSNQQSLLAIDQGKKLITDDDANGDSILDF